MAMESLGGSMPEGRPVAVFAGGKTHVFAIGVGGVMNHWKSSNGVDWSGPDVLLGGNTNLAPSYPCAITLQNGSVHVLAIGNGGPFANGGPLLHWFSPDGDFFPPPVLEPAWQIPGSGNGVTCMSPTGNQVDAFAVTQFGIIRYSWNGDTNVSRGAAPLPPFSLAADGVDGLKLPRCVPAAVSSGPDVTDVFAVSADGSALRWHGPNPHAWFKTVLPRPAGAPAGPLVRAGFAAVPTSPGRVEMFAVTSDGRLTTWWFDGSTIAGVGQLPSPPIALHNNSVPAAVMVDGHLEVFAIGQPSHSFTGGPLVRWRRDGGTWSVPNVIGGNLAAGGLGAVKGAAGLEAFAFNAGTNNSLQHWPAGIRGASNDPWANWVNNRQTTPTGHCYPASLEELVAIVKTAEQQGSRVRAVGSSWSFSDIAMTPGNVPGYVVETNKLDKLIPGTIVPNALRAPHATSTQPHHLVHVEAGIQLENLMMILDGIPLTLPAGTPPLLPARAPYTMGGAAGQTLAGVISTSVHGSHFRLPPFPDWVRAIHLVGPDGKQHWIEPKDRPITDKFKLQAALGPDVRIHYDDDWFDAALVTVGGLGIIYSVVLQVKEQYKLTETITPMKWKELREQLANGRWFATNNDAVQVAIDPGSMGDSNPDCYLSERITAPMSTPPPPSGSISFDPLAAFCEGDIIIDLLFLAAKELGKPEIIGPALVVALPAIPAVAALAVLLPPVMAALVALTAATVTTAVAVPGLIHILKAAGPGAIGDVVGAVLDKHPELTAHVMRELTRTFQPSGSRTDIAHQLMAPRNKGECAIRCLAIEIAFDMADQSHLQFLDASLAMLKDEAAMGRILGGYFAVRFVGQSRAILSPQKSGMTCMVEVVGLRRLNSTKVLLGRLESLGRSFGGIQHWGMFDDLKYEDVARSYPRLDTWLRVRQQITSDGAIRTFDNAFMERCGLIPTAKPKILLRHPNDGAIYVIYGGAKFHVPDPTTLDRLFPGVPVRDAQAGELEHVGNVPGDGTLLHEETTGKVFVTYGGAKFHVPNWDTLTRLFPGFLLRPLWSGALDHIPDRPADGTLLREENGTIWVTFGGAKFHVPDPNKELPALSSWSPTVVNELFGRYVSRRGPLHQVWDGALALIPTIPVDGALFREASSNDIYVIRGGRKEMSLLARFRRGVPAPTRTVYVVWDGALAQIP